MMDIKKIAEECHEIAKSKGWYDKPRSSLEIHALIASELGEAINCTRVDREPYYYINLEPHGEAFELVDAIIRILDYFEYQGWNVEKLLKEKMEYNKTRSYRHGNKKY